MPASASTPTHPRSTAVATTSSQDSPAATVTSTPPQVGSSPSTSARTPRVATSTTVPSKPASATTTLLPPPSTRTGPSTLDIASTSSASVVARTQAAAGPPSLSVVWSARSSGTYDGLRHAEDLLPVRGDGQRHRGQAVLGLLGLAGHLDLDGTLGRDDDGRGELAAQRDQLGAGVPVRHRAGGEGHGVHAVGDHAGQPDAAGHLLVLVDRVVVAARLRVRHQVGAGDVVGHRLKTHRAPGGRAWRSRCTPPRRRR